MVEYKIVLVGAGGVGKSALVTQLMQNHFSEGYDPTIEDSYRKQLTVDGENYLLDILDTAGQEEYSTMRDQYMRQGMGFIGVFAVDNPSTLNEIESTVDQIRGIKQDTQTPIIIVGNKCDLPKRVETKRIDDIKRNLNLSYIETSAKNRTNVEELFASIVRLVRDKSVMDPKKNNKKKGGCIVV